MHLPTISVIGLGKLGLPFAVAAASRGYKVSGVDISTKIIDSINHSASPYIEPKLSEYLQKYKKNIHATTNYTAAINNSGITFIIVPTPSLESGAFSNKFVQDALLKVARALRLKKGFHAVAIVSTVMPLSCDRQFVKILEKESGKKIGVEIGLCYNPSFVALGNVIDNILNPDLVLIGTNDPKSAGIITDFHKRLTLNKPPVQTLNFVNSEISKIALNTYITTKISYGNMLAELCEKTVGADSNSVINAIGLDSRVGKKYLQGGASYGGPCFPRDNRALQSFGKQIGVSLPLARATEMINKKQTSLIAQKILKTMPKNAIVGIIGLAYKADTDVVEEAQGIHLAQFLAKKHVSVRVYDPLVPITANNLLGSTVSYSETLENLVATCAVIIITTALSPLKEKLPKLLTAKKCCVIMIYDLWSIVRPEGIPVSIVYNARGKYANEKKLAKKD